MPFVCNNTLNCIFLKKTLHEYLNTQGQNGTELCLPDTPNCTPAGESSSSYLAFLCYKIILPILVTVGIVGNSAVLWVFSAYKSRNGILPIRILVSQLMVTNISLLLVSLYQWFVVAIWKHLAVGLYFAYPLAHTLRCMSLWMNVMISIDRYFAVTQPLQHQATQTPRRVIWGSMMLVLAAVLYNLPRVFEIEMVSLCYCDGSRGIGPQYSLLARNAAYNLAYRVIMFAILVLLVPIALITALNVRIFVHLNRSYVARDAMCWRKLSHDHGTTVMLVAESLMFLICNLLPVLMNILEFICSGVWVNRMLHRIVYINNLPVLVSVSSSFFIFLAFGSQFRSMARQQFTGHSQTPALSEARGSYAHAPSFMQSSNATPTSRRYYGSMETESRYGMALEGRQRMTVQMADYRGHRYSLATEGTAVSSSGTPVDLRLREITCPSQYDRIAITSAHDHHAIFTLHPVPINMCITRLLSRSASAGGQDVEIHARHVSKSCSF